MKRCDWAPLNDPLYTQYHDEEWGVPLHDDRLLFEFLILEGAQAGLSWRTVLYKRGNYRKAFSGFDPVKIARFTENKIQKLLENPGIIRNKLKVNSAVKNARAFLNIQKEFGSFDSFIWSFVKGKPVQNRWKKLNELPSETQISKKMSKELKKRGFNFVGSTICYSFMQAVGMVNDHQMSCFRYKQIKQKGV